ncbi:unnamed protein product [Lota lota]
MDLNQMSVVFAPDLFRAMEDHLQDVPRQMTSTPATDWMWWRPIFRLMKIMLKVSDISNEARSMAVAVPWLDCLLQEFFNQCFPRLISIDSLKLKCLPVTPFMDRDTVSKPSSQTSFIRFVLLPLFTELTKLFP